MTIIKVGLFHLLDDDRIVKFTQSFLKYIKGENMKSKALPGDSGLLIHTQLHGVKLILRNDETSTVGAIAMEEMGQPPKEASAVIRLKTN